MTKEEALKTWLPIISMSIDNIPELEEAFDMAVKALEQEPTTKNDLGVDAVSRKAVINQIFYSTDNNGDVVLGSALWQRIARLPSITPQERKGHWIDTNDDGFLYHRIYKCSHCGATVCDYPENIQKYKYCSNCGTKMVEPQESEDKE